MICTTDSAINFATNEYENPHTSPHISISLKNHVTGYINPGVIRIYHFHSTARVTSFELSSIPKRSLKMKIISHKNHRYLLYFGKKYTSISQAPGRFLSL